MENLRLRVAFISSCIFHLLLLSWIKIIPVNKPIVISFPVELISLPSYEKMVEDKIVVPVPQKKEEIVIPRKKQKKVVEKKVEQKVQQQETVQPLKETPQPPTSLPSLSLETAKFPFTYYVNQVRKKIVENWLWSQNYPGELKTVVYFKILRSGEITDLKIKESSNNKLYDNICLRAVEIAKPFPPLPEGFKEDYLGVYFEFKYKE